MEDQTTTEAASTDAQPASDTSQPSSLDQALGGDGELISEIEQTLVQDDGLDPAAPVSAMDLPDLIENADGPTTVRDLDLLSDVDVEVAVEFGRTQLPLRQLLMLRRGSLVELERRPEQQVTILANGKPIALGDVVVVGDQIGVHIVELIDPDEPPPTTPPLATVEIETPEEEPSLTDGTAADEAPEGDSGDAGESA